MKVKLAQRQADRKKLPWVTLPNIQVPVAVFAGLELAAGELKLPMNVLIVTALEAFVELVYEDHNIRLPLMLQQVEPA